MRVLGVDGAKGGWVVVALEDGRFVDAWFAPAFADVIVDSAVAIGVDIPLGETTPGARAAEPAARKFLGRGNGPKVFTPPPLDAEHASSYAEACAIAMELTGKKITQQAWHLLPKMLDVNPHWRADPRRIREIHPECSFREMRGATLPYSKKTWAGMWHRVESLRSRGIEVPATAERIAAVGQDDVVDAAAAAWTAHRIASGAAASLPETPERDAAGRLVAIWY